GAAARRARHLARLEADRGATSARCRGPAAPRPQAVRCVPRAAGAADSLRGRRATRSTGAVHHARRRRSRGRGLLLPACDPGPASAPRLPLPLPMRVAGLLGANALIFLVGLGLLPWLGVARSWRQLVVRCGLAYLCGLVAVGILAAQLALAHVGFGWPALAVVASLSALRGAPSGRALAGRAGPGGAG